MALMARPVKLTTAGRPIDHTGSREYVHANQPAFGPLKVKASVTV